MNDLAPSILSWLTEAACYGSLAIITILAVSPAIRRLLGAQAAHLLWLMVLLRLLAPLPALPHPWTSATPPTLSQGLPEAGKTQVHIQVEDGISSPPAKPVASIPWTHWLVSAWAAGVAILSAFTAARVIRTSRLVRRAVKVDADPRIRAALARLSAPKHLRIHETAELRSPALCGLLRPVVLLPAGWEKSLGDDELRSVLAHEIGHYRRADILWRWAFLLARTLHWYNPLVWWAERSARVDQEMACDEWVMQNAGISTVEEYGEALLKTAQISTRTPLGSLTHVAMAESRASLGRRIHHLTLIRPHGWPALAMAGAGALALALLVGPARSESATTPTASTPRSASPPPESAAQEIDLKIEAKMVEITEAIGDGEAGLLDSHTGKRTSTILSPAEAGRLLKWLSNRKGIDILSTPSVITKSGHRAIVSITREFRFPTTTDKDGNVSFEVRPVGVTLEVEPSVAANGEITLGLNPRVTEFEGFINYAAEVSSPQTGGKDALSAVLDKNLENKNSILRPVFQVRSFNSSVVVKNGQTVLLGGLAREDTQIVSEPGREDVEQPLRRSLYLFITPSVAPAGSAPPKTP